MVEIKEELASQRFRLDLIANVMIQQEEIISIENNAKYIY